MAGANSEFKKLLLKGIFYDAQGAGVVGAGTGRALALQAALRLAVSGQYNSTPNGMVIVATAGNGQSAQFALPQAASQYSPFEISVAVSQLDDLFTDAQTELVTDGITSPTDDQIFARMLELLKPRNSESIDYSRMSQVGCR